MFEVQFTYASNGWQCTKTYSEVLNAFNNMTIVGNIQGMTDSAFVHKVTINGNTCFRFHFLSMPDEAHGEYFCVTTITMYATGGIYANQERKLYFNDNTLDVTISQVQGTWQASKTYQEIYNALSAGKKVTATYVTGGMQYHAIGVRQATYAPVSQSYTPSYYILFEFMHADLAANDGTEDRLFYQLVRLKSDETLEIRTSKTINFAS